MGKVIKNKKIELCLFLDQLHEQIEELQYSMKRRKELAIEKNDTHYQEEDATDLFEEGSSSEFDVSVVDMMEKNGALTKEVKNLKIKQEFQSLLLCEVTEWKNKFEDNKIILTNGLEENKLDVQNIANTQLDIMNQLVIANHELNGKETEITTLEL